MPQTMQFTKYGQTLSVDVPTYEEALPNTRIYVWNMGWKQAAGDGYAGSKTYAEFESGLLKKFDKIVKGLLLPRGQYAPRKTELETEMDAIATSIVLAAANAKKLTLTKAKVEAYVANLLARPGKMDEIRTQAHENIERRGEVALQAINGEDDLLADLV